MPLVPRRIAFRATLAPDAAGAGKFPIGMLGREWTCRRE